MGKTENENGANVSFIKPTPEDIARAQDTLYEQETLYRRFVLGSTPFGDTILWSYDDTLKDEALGFRPMSEYRPAPKMLDSREPAPGVHPAAPNMLARWQS